MRNTLRPRYVSLKLKTILLFFSLFLVVQVFATTSCGHISGFAFSNEVSSVVIQDDGRYYIENLPEDFYLDMLIDGYSQSGKISIKNIVEGKKITIVENYLPYTFPSGNGAWDFGVGEFEVEAEIYNDNNSKGKVCDRIIITFKIFERTCVKISEFEFSNGIDAITIKNGETYNINDLPTDFYVNTVVSDEFGSLNYVIDNLVTKEEYKITENLVPYTFPAGNGEWNLGAGTFQIKSSLFSSNYSRGTLCDQETITFTLENNPQEVFEKGVIEPNDFFNEIKLYPNPVNNQLSVALSLLDNEIMLFKIIDLNGRLVVRSFS